MTTTRREFIGGAGAATVLAAAPAPAADAGPIYPDDAFSRPSVDRLSIFETIDGVGPFMDVRQRIAEYESNELRLAGPPEHAHAAWRFRSRKLPHNALFLQARIRRAPVSISFTARNTSQRSVSFALQSHELTWLPVSENTAAVWTLGASQKVAPGDTHTLTYTFADAHSDVHRAPRFPIVALVVLAHDLTANEPYAIELSGLTVRYAWAPGMRSTSLAAHVNGATAVFDVRFDGDLSANTLDIEVRRAERVLWRIRMNPNEHSALTRGACEVRRAVPWYLPPGQYVVGLVANGYRVQSREARLQIAGTTPKGGKLAFPRAERRTHNGRPAFFFEGKPFPWSGYSSYDYQPGNVAEFGASGTNVFCVPTCAGRHVHHVSEATWIAPNRFDFGELDERVCFSLQANPKALIFLRVSLALPPFWLQAHDDELARIGSDIGPLVWEEGNGTRVASIASDTWRRDQAIALRRLIRHCAAQPWAKRVAGFWLTCEVTEEWFAWASNDGKCSDYSKPMRRRFADWASDPRRIDSVGTSEIPSPEQRHRPGYDLYPEDGAGRAAAGFHGFLSDLTAEAIGQFSRIVKEETAGRSLAGCFYGYVIELAGEQRQAISGHFGLRRIVDDPNVDMLAGVPLLDYRSLADGYNPYCSATESIVAAGKLYCSENDLFSWLHPILWHQEYDPKDPRGAAISMHRRECANDSVHGAMAQKFSLSASWHHDAGLHADFARQNAVYARALSFDRTSASEIAFVVDDTSFAWTPPESTLLGVAHKRLLHDLGRTGAPVGVWLLSDIDRLPERIRLVVIANASAARAADIEKLRRIIDSGGRTVVAVGPVGLVEPERGRWDLNRPANVLGLPIRVVDAALPGAWSAGKTAVSTIGPVRPRASVADRNLGAYTDGQGARAERNLPNGGRLIWCGAPPTETVLLRSWAEAAGVHLYAPAGNFVHASRELAAVTAWAAADIELRWPFRAAVTDLFERVDGHWHDHRLFLRDRPDAPVPIEGRGVGVTPGRTLQDTESPRSKKVPDTP